MKQPIGIVALLFFLATGGVGAAAEKRPAPKGDGTIALYNYHEREYAEITFRRNGRDDPEALSNIEHLLRSRDGKTHRIDRQLIDLIDHLQDHFGAETVEIISGYRSRAYNADLRTNGRGAASESLHTKGLAADIHLDEIREEALAAYARSLGVGGVGLYPRYAFVHVDVGPRRNWDEAPAKRRILVGAENNPNPSWRATTDRNRYTRGETLSLEIINEAYAKQRLKQRVLLQRFGRGAWQEPTTTAKGGRRCSLAPGETTTITWTIPKEQPLGKYRCIIFPGSKKVPPIFSNEFYVKQP